MKSTITVKLEDVHDWEDVSLSDCDYTCWKIAKYFACTGSIRGSGISLDTISVHANAPDEVGIRFYYKTPKAKNRRNAFFAEFIFTLSDIDTQIMTEGFEPFCKQLADDAISQILEEIKK